MSAAFDASAPFRKIIVGLDDSPAGREALVWGLDEADLHGANLHVVHVVWPPEHPGRSDNEILEAARLMVEYNIERANAKGLVTSEVVSPQETGRMDPGKVLAHKSADADLVAIGAFGFSAGRDFGELVTHTTGESQKAGRATENLSSGETPPLHRPSHLAVVHAPQEKIFEMNTRILGEKAWTESRRRAGPQGK